MTFIKLRFSGELLNPKQLTDLFSINPDFECRKKDTRVYKGKEIIYPEGCWTTGVEVADITVVNEKILSLLSPFSDYKEQIRQMANELSITLWITFYPEHFNMNFHISNPVIELVSQLGISMDVSVMNLQDLY